MEKLKYKLLTFLWRLLDYLVPKDKQYWAFATHHLRATKFIENQRAIFEHIKSKPEIKKFIFYRDSKHEIDIQDAVNYEIIKQGTFRAYTLLFKCKVVFITHSLAMDYSIRFGKRDFEVLKFRLDNRIIVNLWHGISMKRLLNAANDETKLRTDRSKFRQKERKFYKGLIASSSIDGLIMAAMFYPLNYSQIWETGLPRNDFLLMPDTKLPAYIRASIEQLRSLKKAKKLLVYAPTYRQTAVSKDAYYYQFSNDEIENLKHLLKESNAILAYRPHYFKNDPNYFNLDQFIDNEYIFDCSQNVIPEFSALARECDLLITDYSSVALETIYLDKPTLSFAYDIENYQKEQDGLIYDLSMIFDQDIYQDYESLLLGIKGYLSSNGIKKSNEMAKKLFFSHRDTENSQRVVDKIKMLENKI